MIKKIVPIISLFLFAIFIVPVFMGKTEAASLKFDKTSFSANVNDVFQIQVIVDAGSEQILSTDAYILYDASAIQAQSVASGTFFPTVNNEVTSGKIYIAGMVSDPGTSKTGSGAVATITFKALKAATVNLTFDCRAGASDSSKIIKNDFNATNIIDCATNGSCQAIIGGGSSSSTSSTTSSTGSNSSSTASTSTLPNTGIVENLMAFSIPGIVLLLIGGAVRLILLR